jgi:hypothetical protein
MGYFAGLDVSVKETSVCIVDDGARKTRRGGTRTGVSHERSHRFRIAAAA